MDQYYYSINKQQIGPVSRLELEDLRKSGRINDATLVWTQGMSQWLPYAAAMAPAGQSLPSGQSVPVSLLKPSNGLVWAILATLFCCLPLGIVAIIKASSVDELWFSGQYNAAIEAARSAKTWTLWSVLSYIIVFFPYILVALGELAGL